MISITICVQTKNSSNLTCTLGVWTSSQRGAEVTVQCSGWSGMALGISSSTHSLCVSHPRRACTPEHRVPPLASKIHVGCSSRHSLAVLQLVSLTPPAIQLCGSAGRHHRFRPWPGRPAARIRYVVPSASKGAVPHRPECVGPHRLEVCSH